LLCSFHQRQVHEGGFTITFGEDAAVMVCAPDGWRLPDTPLLAGDVGAV